MGYPSKQSPKPITNLNPYKIKIEKIETKIGKNKNKQKKAETQ